MCAGSVRTLPRTWLSWHGRSMTWQVKSTRSVPPAPHRAPPSAQPRPRQAPPSTPGRRYCLSLNFLHSFKEIYLVAKVLVLNKFFIISPCLQLVERVFDESLNFRKIPPVVHTKPTEVNGRPVELRPRAPDSLDPQAALRRRTWNRDEVRPV